MTANIQSSAGRQVAQSLVNLTKGFKSNDPVQATDFRKAFKELSKNDLTRIMVYLLELVGSRDLEFKYIKGENNDLRELLKVNGIDPDKEVDDENGHTNTEAPIAPDLSISGEGTEQTGIVLQNSPVA